MIFIHKNHAYCSFCSYRAKDQIVQHRFFKNFIMYWILLCIIMYLHFILNRTKNTIKEHEKKILKIFKFLNILSQKNLSKLKFCSTVQSKVSLHGFDEKKIQYVNEPWNLRFWGLLLSSVFLQNLITKKKSITVSQNIINDLL
jgi:hypothetical protein